MPDTTQLQSGQDTVITSQPPLDYGQVASSLANVAASNPEAAPLVQMMMDQVKNWSASWKYYQQNLAQQTGGMPTGQAQEFMSKQGLAFANQALSNLQNLATNVLPYMSQAQQLALQDKWFQQNLAFQKQSAADQLALQQQAQAANIEAQKKQLAIQQQGMDINRGNVQAGINASAFGGLKQSMDQDKARQEAQWEKGEALAGRRPGIPGQQGPGGMGSSGGYATGGGGDTGAIVPDQQYMQSQALNKFISDMGDKGYKLASLPAQDGSVVLQTPEGMQQMFYPTGGNRSGQNVTYTPGYSKPSSTYSGNMQAINSLTGQSSTTGQQPSSGQAPYQTSKPSNSNLSSNPYVSSNPNQSQVQPYSAEYASGGPGNYPSQTMSQYSTASQNQGTTPWWQSSGSETSPMANMGPYTMNSYSTGGGQPQGASVDQWGMNTGAGQYIPFQTMSNYSTGGPTSPAYITGSGYQTPTDIQSQPTIGSWWQPPSGSTGSPMGDIMGSNTMSSFSTGGAY